MSLKCLIIQREQSIKARTNVTQLFVKITRNKDTIHSFDQFRLNQASILIQGESRLKKSAYHCKTITQTGDVIMFPMANFRAEPVYTD